MTVDNFIPDDKYYFIERIQGNMETCLLKEDVKKMMINYGKYCVEQALKSASENAVVEEKFKLTWSDEFESYFIVDKDSILNSYPSENIK